MRIPMLAATLGAIALVAGGCGGTQPTKTVTITSTSPASKPSEKTPRHSRHHARHHKDASALATTTASPTLSQCDQNIAAKLDTTSCEFAENVFWAYWHAHKDDSSTFSAFSPVTQQTYDVSCNEDSVVICHASEGAEVRFPMAAVLSYSADQADSYAASHDTGVPTDTTAPTDSSSGAASSANNCDPNYKGACLDPTAVDYDCAGGSGDGPDYTGPVEVVGEDHYDLDRDGDGIACE